MCRSKAKKSYELNKVQEELLQLTSGFMVDVFEKNLKLEALYVPIEVAYLVGDRDAQSWAERHELVELIRTAKKLKGGKVR